MSSNPKFSSAPSASSLGSIWPFPIWFGRAQQSHARLDFVRLASEVRQLCMGVYRFDFPFLAMTCASPSFRLSGKCPHSTHSPFLSAHVQIPFIYCLGTLVLDRLAFYPTHGIPLTTRIHRDRCGDEQRGRRCRNEESRELSIGHQSCVRILSRTRDVIRASHVLDSDNTPLQPRSRTDRLRVILISWCPSVFTFLRMSLCCQVITAGICLRSSELDRRTECEGA